MSHTLDTPSSHQDLPPLGSVTREPTAVDRLANDYFAAAMALDPSAATYNGLPGHESEYPDFGPAGRAAAAELVDRTLRATDAAQPVDDVDRVTLHALRERLELERDVHTADADAAVVNNIESPVQNIRNIFDVMPAATAEHWEHITARLANVPAAIDSYLDGLREAVSLGRPPSTPQLREACTQATSYASDTGSFAGLAADPRAPESLRPELEAAASAARGAYSHLAGVLAEEFGPGAKDSDAVGEDEYRLRLREFLGAREDPREAYEWGVAHLLELDREQRDLAEQIVPGGSIREAMDALNADPARQLHSTAALQQWMQGLSDAAVADLADTHFEITPKMRTLECCIAPTQDGIIYYSPPTLDFSRPGRMWWSVPEGVAVHTTWEETTTVYHEGVPGHHLQTSTAIENAGELNDWRRIGIWVSGHGEGWALYAERLMAELGYLDDPGDRMGMLDSQRLRTLRVIFDIGFHCGYTIPRELEGLTGAAEPGQLWGPEAGWEFLRSNVVMDPQVLRFEWLRYMGWPGQAPSYKVGQRLWLQAREDARAREGADFDLRRFHSRALRLGSVGLDTLSYALSL